MARPQKIGLDYFPLNTDIIHNRKIALIESEFGSKGFAIAIKILCEIYRENGYYLIYDEETQLLLAKAFGEPGSLVGEVVSRCIKRGIFNDSVFNMFQVLTSKTIQENYLSGSCRREKVEIESEILLADINVYKNVISVNINFKNVDAGTQSRVEESRVEERRGERVIPDLVFPFSSENFKGIWNLWKEFKLKEHKFKYKSIISEQAALKDLAEISDSNELVAIKIIEKSMAKGWQGLFALKEEKNAGQSKFTEQNRGQKLAAEAIAKARGNYTGS